MPDILLSDHTIARMRTDTGNTVAADINSGKTAVVDGVLVTGTALIKPLPAQNGILLWVEAPISLSGYRTYLPHNTHAKEFVLIKDTSVTGFGSSPSWTLTTNGWAYHDLTAWASFIQGTFPAYTTRRKYEFWGAVQDVALTTDWGVRIIFNYVDANNYWSIDLRWNGSAFYYTIYEVTAGVGTTRGTVTFSTALDLPARWHLIVYEQGDSIVCQCAMNELDVWTDDYIATLEYTVGSRPHKNTGACIFGLRLGPSSQWLINGCRVTDLLG